MAMNLFEAGCLDQLAVSINAVGTGSRGKIGDVDTFIVEGLTKGRSVDWVTEPGAGGRAGLLESADNVIDTLTVDLDTLKEVRSDLVDAIRAESEPKITQEVKKKLELETEVKDLKESNDKLIKENADLKAEKEAALKTAAQASIKEAIAKAQLPDATVARLVERFKDATTDEGVAEAIKAEVDYIAKIKESGKVKGMGPQAGSDKNTTHEALVESFKKMGLSKEAAEIAATGR
jgi:hypothetical protein